MAVTQGQSIHQRKAERGEVLNWVPSRRQFEEIKYWAMEWEDEGRLVLYLLRFPEEIA